MNLQTCFTQRKITPALFTIKTYFSTAAEVIALTSSLFAVFKDDKTQLISLSTDVVIAEAENVIERRKKIVAKRNTTELNIMVFNTIRGINP